MMGSDLVMNREGKEKVRNSLIELGCWGDFWVRIRKVS